MIEKEGDYAIVQKSCSKASRNLEELCGFPPRTLPSFGKLEAHEIISRSALEWALAKPEKSRNPSVGLHNEVHATLTDSHGNGGLYAQAYREVEKTLLAHGQERLAYEMGRARIELAAASGYRDNPAEQERVTAQLKQADKSFERLEAKLQGERASGKEPLSVAAVEYRDRTADRCEKAIEFANFFIDRMKGLVRDFQINREIQLDEQRGRSSVELNDRIGRSMTYEDRGLVSYFTQDLNREYKVLLKDRSEMFRNMPRETQAQILDAEKRGLTKEKSINDSRESPDLNDQCRRTNDLMKAHFERMEQRDRTLDDTFDFRTRGGR